MAIAHSHQSVLIMFTCYPFISKSMICNCLTSLDNVHIYSKRGANVYFVADYRNFNLITETLVIKKVVKVNWYVRNTYIARASCYLVTVNDAVGIIVWEVGWTDGAIRSMVTGKWCWNHLEQRFIYILNEISQNIPKFHSWNFAKSHWILQNFVESRKFSQNFVWHNRKSCEILQSLTKLVKFVFAKGTTMAPINM